MITGAELPTRLSVTSEAFNILLDVTSSWANVDAIVNENRAEAETIAGHLEQLLRWFEQPKYRPGFEPGSLANRQ